MPLTRRSKVKDAWRHPVGHQVLLGLARRTGHEDTWPQRPLIANMPLYGLDRVAGAGFCDMLLEAAAHAPDDAAHPPDEGKHWWKESLIYRVFVPSFMDSDHDGVGDFGGVAQRLPYLARLGVGALWLGPVTDTDENGAVRNYEALCETGGTMAGFEALVRAAHERGMKVLISLDLHATSEEHPWFRRLRAGKSEDDCDYVVRPGAPDAPPNNWMRAAKSSAWRWHAPLAAWVLQLHGRAAADLNWERAAVRAKMARVLAFWQKKGVDGFCFGPVDTLSKAGYEDGFPLPGSGAVGAEKYAFGPRLHRYLCEVRAAAPPPLLLAGEVRHVGAGMARLLAAQQRRELDLVLDPAHLQARARPRSEEKRLTLLDLRQYALRWQKGFAAACWMPLFFEGPHTGRLVSRVGASPLYRAILAKLLGTWLLTMRGTPILYQGQELGLANTRLAAPEEMRDARSKRMYAEALDRLGDVTDAWQSVCPHLAEHTMAPMPWGPGPNAGFTGAVPWMRMPDGTDYLNAAAQMEDGGSVFTHYQKLASLRRQSACLIYGSFNAVFEKNKKVLCYFRIFESEKWYVEMNLTEKEAARPGRISRMHRLVLSNYDTPSRSLRPYEANLYRCE